MSAIGKIKASRVNNQTANTFVGQLGTIFYDASNGLLRFSDGVTPGGQPIAVALPPGTITMGNLEVVNTTLSTFLPNDDLILASNGTGNVELVGNVHIHTTGDGITGNIVFSVMNDGFTVIKVPQITTGRSGLLIDGTLNHGGVGPQVPGVTLRCVGNDGVSSIISNDSFGNVAFPSIVHRYARGTSQAPTATQSGDKFGLFVGLGYGTTNYSLSSNGIASTSIDFAATENYTDTKNGSQIEFYTAPTGSNVRTLSATITANTTVFPSNVSISGFYTGKYIRTVRNAGTIADGGTLTIDFSTDAVVYCTWANGMTVNYSNYIPGRVVKVMCTKASGSGTDSLSLDGVTASQVSSGSTTVTAAADTTTFLEVTCVGTTLGSVYVKV
jgi:hypothetical protein